MQPRGVAEFVLNKFDTENAWFEGYEHVRNGHSWMDVTQYWRCSKRYRQGVMCHGTLLTNADGSNARFGLVLHNNNCHPEPNRMLARKAINETKATAKETTIYTSTIVKRVRSRLQPDVAQWYGKRDSMGRVVSRARRIAQGGVDLGPKTLAGLRLTPYMCRHPYDPNGTILIWDTGGADLERIMIFGTAESTRLLELHHHWAGDGTFSVCPSVFDQLYTIHVTIGGKTVPMVFVLMPNRERGTYVRMLQLLLAACPALAQNPPTHLMTDFEAAAYNAFRQVFPNVELTGCFFHLQQCVWRRCQSLGLTAAYESDLEAAMCAKMLASLAFVPPANLVRAHNDIQATAAARMAQRRFPALVMLTTYFERNFILGRGRGAIGGGPRYPIPLWNCYDRCVAGCPRTNNGIEGWHRSFNKSVGMHHPMLYHLLNVIREELGSATNEQVLYDRVPGINPSPQKPRDRRLNERVLRLVRNYHNNTHYAYCRALAYTFSFT